MYALRRILFEGLLPAFCVLGIAYNMLLTLNGPEGMKAKSITETRLGDYTAELEALKLTREKLAREARLLSLDSLNRDVLDERARSRLRYAAPGEFVVPLAELDRLIMSQ